MTAPTLAMEAETSAGDTDEKASAPEGPRILGDGCTPELLDLIFDGPLESPPWQRLVQRIEVELAELWRQTRLTRKRRRFSTLSY